MTIDSSSHSNYQHNDILTDTAIDNNKEHKEQPETLNNGQETETENEIVKTEDGVILDNNNDNMELDTSVNSDSDTSLLEEEGVREEERVSTEHTVIADGNNGTVIMDSEDNGENGENGENGNGGEDSNQEREEKKDEEESIEVDVQDSEVNNNESNQDISSHDELVLDNGTINDNDDEEQSDDIVTFEEFKNKMNQEVVNTKPTGL